MSEIPTVSVIIKTYNEAKGIAKTINSIRENLHAYPHEIIVADSLSSDNTQHIALELGATVVTLVNGEERCCGVGHQLGYLHAQGEFLLLLDGDMQLAPGFIEKGIEFLHTHPDYAGVAGEVEMDEAVSYEFKSRKQRLHLIYPLGMMITWRAVACIVNRRLMKSATSPTAICTLTKRRNSACA